MIVRCLRSIVFISLGFFLIGPMVSVAQSDADQYDYIDISNPFLRKIPLAVPLFKNVTGTGEEERLSKSAAELLSSSLAYTGYFKILDRGAFLFDPAKDGVLTPQINFANWTVIGAELLITGLCEVTNGRLAMELRLFDTFKNKRILGKKYAGRPADQRKIIHRFCSEVIQYLTGHKGMFASKIAFVSTGSGNKEIYSCEFDGYSPQQVTRNHEISLFPAWSSDGRYLAYTSFKGGKPDLFIKNLAEMREVSVAEKGINITPAWVPGKFELAAALSFSGDQEIYLLTGTGKIIKRLTRMRGSDISPSWSPDGKKIAFVSTRSGNPQIYIKDLVSDKARRLTYKGNYNTQPCWSPRGDKITYSSLVDGRHNIFIIDVDGLEPLQLTHESGDNEAPSWSPDGSMIVFSSNREGLFRIYVMTAFGTDQRRLLMMKGEQTNPKWSMNDFDN
ncbi:Tol-Pal system beta propeller repeat protein TolB [Olavius sp. associated proteobacterium Delta 1]|nr:Tol-Pal system beta propeller repeat protein TolB [Olavius sp. associated proteobacterium Delta 1]